MVLTGSADCESRERLKVLRFATRTLLGVGEDQALELFVRGALLLATDRRASAETGHITYVNESAKFLARTATIVKLQDARMRHEFIFFQSEKTADAAITLASRSVTTRRRAKWAILDTRQQPE
jgi:hypothetical protein